MKRIVFCNSLSLIKKALHGEREHWSYLTIGCNKNSLLINKFLKDKKNCTEINLGYFDNWRQEYSKKFVNYIGELNTANAGNLLWWALDFTSKNPISTPLCNRVFYSLFIAKIIEEYTAENLFIVSEDREICRQLRIWFKNKNIKIVDKVKFAISKNSFKALIRRYTPFAIFFAILRVLVQKLSLRAVSIDKDKDYTVILSLLNHQSFRSNGSYEDTYFGELVSYILKRELPVINFLYVNTPQYRKMVKHVQKAHSSGIMLTLEYFLSVIDILRCFLTALSKYYNSISEKVYFDIDGRDVSYLARSEIRSSYTSTCFFDNLRKYYSVKNLSKNVRIDKFYYPFENRSFEKMALLALRKFSAKTRIIGYQHTSLSLQHANFLLTKEELKIIPFPDKIITIGDITRSFMKDLGNFPSALLERGCALRQKKYSSSLKVRKNISNLLVVLATNLEEYVQVMMFLSSAFADNAQYKVWIRPHPRLLLLEEAIEVSGLPRFPFYKSDKETLEECLQWSDAVLYVCSTVAIEALARGIPIVYLNINNILNPDPVIDFNDLRWQADTPDDLRSIIEEIDELPESDFHNRQKRAVDYAERYSYPVNQSTLDIFLKV